MGKKKLAHYCTVLYTLHTTQADMEGVIEYAKHHILFCPEDQLGMKGAIAKAEELLADTFNESQFIPWLEVRQGVHSGSGGGGGGGSASGSWLVCPCLPPGLFALAAQPTQALPACHLHQHPWPATCGATAA